MAYYKSQREYLEALDKAGMLVTITSPINKDTQLYPLLRLQDRGLPEEQRKVFLFTNVIDSRGKKYDMPVAVYMGVIRQISAIALQCQPQEIAEKVAQAMLHPIEPRLVKQGPVQEVVYMGDSLLKKGGLDEFPVPNATPGYDSGPICHGTHWVTKDIETGIRNVGVYRAQVYAQNRIGIHLGEYDSHLAIHWHKCRAKGIPLPVAIVIGGPPNVGTIGGTSLPYGVDEYTVSGALAGQPVELVKCKTVDLEVPANADIVIEGEMTTEELEQEAPHGEPVKGYIGMHEMQPYVTVKCITHRKDPIWQAEGGGPQALLYKRLKYDLNMPHVLAIGSPNLVGFPGHLIIIKVKMHTDQKEVWRTLEAVETQEVGTVIAVDEDIDINNYGMVWWAIGTRVQPHRDTRIVRFRSKSLRPSSFMPEEESKKVRFNQFDPNLKLPEASTLLINATLKWAYPPVMLPKKEFMEGALAIWRELGLPPLKLQEPWYAYELGYWPDDCREDAERAVRGEYYKTSEMRAKKRVKVPRISPKQAQKFLD